MKSFKIYKFLLSILFAQTLYAQVTTWPVVPSQKLTAGFGEFRPNYSAKYGPHFHGGIDIGDDSNGTQTQYIVAAGEISAVTYVSSTGSSGDSITITHPDGTQSVYLELDNGSFSNYEDTVNTALANSPNGLAAGTTIAQMGICDSGVPCLHFEVRSSSDTTLRLNPLSFYPNPDPSAPTFEPTISYVFKPLYPSSWIIPMAAPTPNDDTVDGQVQNGKTLDFKDFGVDVSGPYISGDFIAIVARNSLNKKDQARTLEIFKME